MLHPTREIYFARELQQRALHLFAFALRAGGYLALGKSETANPLPEFFTLQHTQHNIYRREGRLPPPLPTTGALPLTAQRSEQMERRFAAQELFRAQ